MNLLHPRLFKFLSIVAFAVIAIAIVSAKEARAAAWSSVSYAYDSRNAAASAVYNNKIWIVGGTSGAQREVFSSTDGVNGAAASYNPAWSARRSHSAVVFNDR